MEAAAERARASGDEAGEALAPSSPPHAQRSSSSRSPTSTCWSARPGGPAAARGGRGSRRASCTSGVRSATASPTRAGAWRTGPTRPSSASTTPAPAGVRRATDLTASWRRSSAGRGRRTRRCGRSMSCYPSPSEPSASLMMRAYLLAMLGRFDEAWRSPVAAGRAPARARGRPQITRCGSWTSPRSQATTRPPRGTGSSVDALRGARARAPSRRATARSSAAGCARSAATTRPSRSPGSAGSSGGTGGATGLWRQVQALVLAHRGEHAEAEALAREAVAIAERTDVLSHQGDGFCDLAEVLARRRPQPRRPPRRSSRRWSATSARRTWPWPHRCEREARRAAREAPA